MSSPDSADSTIVPSPSGQSSTPKFTSFNPSVRSNTIEPSESHRSTSDRETASREQRSRGSQRRDGRSESPRKSSSRHYRRRSREASRDRDRRSRRQREEEEACHASLDSTRSRERRPRSERRPPTKPYPHGDSEPSSTSERLFLGDVEESGGSREPISEQRSASEKASEVDLSQPNPPHSVQGQDDTHPSHTSGETRDSRRADDPKTPLRGLKLALAYMQQSNFQDSGFPYPPKPAILSSEIKPADMKPDELFFEFDDKGDPDILRFGRPKHPLNYRVGGGGRVLGLGKEYRIDRLQSDHTGVVIRRVVGDTFTGDPCTREKQKEFASTGDHPQIPHYEQRIQTGPRIAPRSRFQSRLFPDPPPTPDLNKSFLDRSSLDPNADFVPLDTDDWEPPKKTDLGVERRTRNAALTKAAFDQPTDVSAWLKVINYQDVLARGSESASLPLTKNELHSLAETKLSLYHKGLRRVGKSTHHRDLLLLGRLQLGAQLWEREKLLEQWKETLSDNPGYIALWAKYLDFFQTDSPTFSYLECLKVHMDALRAVALQRRSDSHFSSLQTYIFLRLTILHREAGYHELATSLWQALIEYCLFKPQRIDDIHESDDALAEFRSFWESEVARIGEPGAEGWNGGAHTEVTPLSFNYSIQDGPSPLMSSWAKAERERMAHLVWRSLDSTNPPLDESQNVCLFSDVREIVQLFSGWDSADPLINAFLCFNHLPPMTSLPNIKTALAWSWDSFLRTGFAEDHNLGLDLWRKEDGEPPKAGEAVRNSHPLTYPLHSFLQTTDTLFTDPDSWVWFSSLPSWDDSQRPGTREMTRRALQSLARRDPGNDELIEYHLAFEFSCDPQAAKKAAKKILKERKQFLRGWNCLAMMEWMAGSRERGNFMWASMISNSADWEPEYILDRGILWQSWIWKYLERGEKPAASHILFSMANGTIDPSSIPEAGQRGMAIGPVIMAQNQSFLRDFQAQALASNNSLAYVANTDCLALLYYLGNWPLKTVLDVYADAVTALEQIVGDLDDWKRYTAELIHQARAKVIYCVLKHQPKGTWKPIEFRPFFKESLTRFPHNTMIAAVWMFTESKILRINRIRTLDDLLDKDPETQTQPQLSEITTPTKPISSILLPIWAEISSARGADRWIVRPMFEKALEGSDGARSNLTIWKLYILYELDHVDDLAAAKSVFYRAINACPWSKELAMLGFEQLQQGMSARPSLAFSNDVKVLKEEKGLSEEEVERLFLVLCERNLHVRLDIRDEVRESLIDRVRSRSPDHMED